MYDIKKVMKWLAVCSSFLTVLILFPFATCDVCTLPRDSGPCRHYIVKWYFDMLRGGCREFRYGGCGGNVNNFGTKEECESICVNPKDPETICKLPRVNGICDFKIPSWYFNAVSKTCQHFIYRGCLGNSNRFSTKIDCERKCISKKNITLENQCELPYMPDTMVTEESDSDNFRSYDKAKSLCYPDGKYQRWSTFVMCEELGEWEEEYEDCIAFKLTFICDQGVWYVGKNSWRYYGKKSWKRSGSILLSNEIQCPDPGVPENGERFGNSFQVGDRVSFRCFTGYFLIGSTERYCRSVGQWDGELSRCDKSSNYCPNPGIPIKGYTNSSSYDMGDMIRFHCQPGYILMGSKVRKCLPNGTWSGAEAYCLGPYDDDNNAEVRDRFARIAKNSELKEKLGKYINGLHHGSPLRENFPDRQILYFAFDVSESVGYGNFQRSLEFAKAIVRKVGISENGALAAAVTFSSAYTHEIMFSPWAYHTTEDVSNAVDEILYAGGNTSYPSALGVFRNEIMNATEEILGESNIKFVIFFLADGNMARQRRLETEADLLKKSGVEIYYIVLTSYIENKYLNKIASTTIDFNGERPNVYILRNYASLSWILQEIISGAVDYSQCGLGMENVGSIKVFGKVVDGTKSEEPWPWMAALHISHRRINTDGLFIGELECGGSIIHQKCILTAAHCLYRENDDYKQEKIQTRDVIVKLGLRDVTDETYVQVFEVLRMFTHPQYRPDNTFDYDIALLELVRPIEYNPFVRPICLPPKELPVNSLLYSPGENCLAIGWGHQERVPAFTRPLQWNMSEVLMEISLPIQTRQKCAESLVERNIRLFRFTNRMFCAGDGKGGRDTCSGDSGGPLMQSQINSDGYLYWTQVGIVSSGVGCAEENAYGFYSHVQRLRTWIDKTIEDASSS